MAALPASLRTSPGRRLLLLDERLRFDDGVLVGEGVEGREDQTAGPRLDRNKAERRDREAVVRPKVVEQAALAAVGEDLIVDVQEDLRWQRLDLEAHLVVDAMGAGQSPVVLAAKAV